MTKPTKTQITQTARTGGPTEQPTPNVASEAEPKPKSRTLREGTKQANLIAMLRAPEGATIEEIMAASNWAAHCADVRLMPM